MDASGTVGKAITFTKNKGTNVVRQWVVPSNPRTPAQTGTRSSFAGLVALWKLNTAEITTNFSAIAAQRNISVFNAFIGFNQKRLSQDKFAADNPAPTEVAPTANVTALARAVNGKYVTLTWIDSVDVGAWQILIYRKLGSAPTGAKSELVAAIPRGSQLYNDGPLAPGTWFYVVRAIEQEGGATGVSASVNGVIT